MLKILLTTLIILSLISFLIPMAIWFIRNLKRNQNPDGYSWKYDAATKWSLIILIPLGIALLIGVFVLVAT